MRARPVLLVHWLKTCRPSMPREGGIYGVWTSSLLFGLLASWPPGGEVLAGIVGALLALAISDMRGVSPLCIVFPTIFFVPLLLEGVPYSLLPAILFPPLYYVTVKEWNLRYVSGAGVVALPGGLLALASGKPLASLLPPLYAMMAAGFAFRRIYGSSPRSLDLLALAGVSAYAVWLYSVGCWIAGLVLAVDIVSRILLRASRVDYRVRLRTYGFLEAFRSSIVMFSVGLVIGFACR